MISNLTLNIINIMNKIKIMSVALLVAAISAIGLSSTSAHHMSAYEDAWINIPETSPHLDMVF